MFLQPPMMIYCTYKFLLDTAREIVKHTEDNILITSVLYKFYAAIHPHLIITAMIASVNSFTVKIFQKL